MRPYYSDESVTLFHGDCLDVMRTLPDASVDAVVTDPPYGLEFMGKGWDSFGGDTRQPFRGEVQTPDNPFGRSTVRYGGTSSLGGKHAEAMRAFGDWCIEWTAECLRILKPGGHLLAFGGTRTWHRLACAVEDAGFEVRDSIAWLHGQGFPKSANPARDQRFCQGCGVESDHADGAPQTTEHGLSGVLDGDVSQAEGAPRGAGEVLLPSVPEHGAPAAGRTELPAAEVRAGEPCMAGRGDHPQAEGELHRAALREVPGGSPLHGEVGRLHHGAPARNGAADRATLGPDGSGEPHQPQPEGQPAGEPGAVPEQRGSQARGGRPVCRGCGKPTAPSGLGTALKPAFEPIVVGRKPLAGTVAANVLEHGTGALNIDGCRVAGERITTTNGSVNEVYGDLSYNAGKPWESHASGRWPTNVVLDDTQAAVLDEMSGERSAGGRPASAGITSQPGAANGTMGGGWAGTDRTEREVLDGGGASRFFPTFRYEAKAPASERPKVNGVAHPTVKPLNLLRWMVRLVTPPGGTVLEPFAGSGTTVEACVVEGFKCVAIEKTDEYLPLTVARIHRRRDPVAAIKLAGDDLGLFDLGDTP